MINGIEELLGEIDKFKDSVQDTVELSSALNNSAEEIKKNTETVNGFIGQVESIVDSSKNEEFKKIEEIKLLVEKSNFELLNRISMAQNSVDKKLKLLFGVSAVGVVTSIIAVIMILIKWWCDEYVFVNDIKITL